MLSVSVIDFLQSVVQRSGILMQFSHYQLFDKYCYSRMFVECYVCVCDYYEDTTSHCKMFLSSWSLPDLYEVWLQ